jgi:hypothetical protein
MRVFIPKAFGKWFEIAKHGNGGGCRSLGVADNGGKCGNFDRSICAM